MINKGLEYNIVGRRWILDKMFFKNTTEDDLIECSLEEVQLGRIWRVHGGKQYSR